MRLLCPTDRERCVPLRIITEADAADGRLGGSPPSVPGLDVEGLKYFLTVRIAADPERQISVFVAGYDRIAEVRGRVNEAGIVRVVVHEFAARMSPSNIDSPLSPHGILILPEEDDWLDDEDGGRVVRSGHKVGGRPHFVRETTRLREGMESATRDGFSYVLQVDFPDEDDETVSGPWPFGDGIFGLFARAPYGRSDWRWWWDF